MAIGGLTATLAVAAAGFALLGSAGPSSAQGTTEPSCSLKVGKPGSISFTASKKAPTSKKARTLAGILQCSERVLGLSLTKPPHKKIDLSSSVQIAQGQPGDTMTCQPRAGNTCSGSVAAYARMRLMGRYRKDVCAKPRLRLTVIARLEAPPCPGPLPCPANPPTSSVQSKGVAGCG